MLRSETYYQSLNRFVWMLIFLGGTALFAWIESDSEDGLAMAFFLETSIWSAVCGIGFTACHWFVHRAEAKRSGN